MYRGIRMDGSPIRLPYANTRHFRDVSVLSPGDRVGSTQQFARNATPARCQLATSPGPINPPLPPGEGRGEGPRPSRDCRNEGPVSRRPAVFNCPSPSPAQAQVFLQRTTENEQLTPGASPELRPPRNKRLQEFHGLRRRRHQVPDRLSHRPSTRLPLHGLDRKLLLQLPQLVRASSLVGEVPPQAAVGGRRVRKVLPPSNLGFSTLLVATLRVGSASPTLRVV